MKYLETRPYEAYNSALFAVSFRMNMNLVQIEREIYSSLDMFGNIGGLLTALLVIFGSLYKLSASNQFENWLVQNLFRA